MFASVRFAATMHWDGLNTVLAVTGCAILALGAVWNRREIKAWLRDPRGVFVVSTGISTAALFGILVLVNIFVWYRPARLDLTESGRNTVSGETRSVLNKLSRDVRLRQFGRSRDPRLDQFLAAFQHGSPRVTVEFVDADREPRETQKYGVLKNGTVVASSGDKYRRVDDPTEQALLTAVLQVTSDVERRICFVTGHGEHGLADEGAKGLSKLAAWLQASNFTVERISLLESDVPAACAALVIAGPQREIEPSELARLTAYADAAGRVALLIDPAPGIAPAEWLEARGVRPGKGLVVDTSGAGQTVGGGPQTPLALAYADHPISRGFEIATIFDWARPLEVIDRPAFGGHPVAIAQTGDRSFEEMDVENQTVRFDADRDRRGPLVLAVATAMDAKRSGRPEDEMRLVVFGDSDFISNGFLNRQGNASLFLRTISWLVGEAEATIVSVQDRENRRINLTEQQRVWMYAVNIGLLPLIPLGIGLIVLIRSRR
jgi:ABC-type uncharacterized transport system involved in gliding motility auxiliary subunit